MAFSDEFGVSDRMPVDIETLVDVGAGLDIIELPRLLEEYGVDGFISVDRTSIYVDQGVARQTSQNRLRFTLAHELGHWYLHAPLCEAALASGSVLAALEQMSEEDRSWYEWQAKSFAGLLLVPRRHLHDSVRSEVERAKGLGFKNINLNEPAHRERVIEKVAQHFAVSSAVVSIRGENDRLW